MNYNNNELTPVAQRQADIAAYEKQVLSCADCSLAVSRTQPVCGNRCYSGDIMLLGEAPGAAEDRLGTPFAGQAGHLLEEFLAATAIPRPRLYIGNVVKCRPVKPGKKPGTFANRTPKALELAACRRHLQAELALVHPRLIVTLGATPLSCFLAEKPVMGRAHGCPFVWQEKQIFPLYHPAAVIYNRTLAGEYAADMEKLAQYILAMDREG